MDVNINDRVLVRLTDYGNEIAKERSVSPFLVGDGWSSWQLWELMAVFGDQMYMGNETCFIGNDIRLLEDEL